MTRETANVLLVLVGGTLVKVAADGSYVRYVKPGLLPYLLVAGVVIVALGLIAVVRDIRLGRAAQTEDAGDGHRHGKWQTWMLLTPVAVILFVSPPALGASSIGSMPDQPTAAAPEKTAFPPLPDGVAPEVPLLDLVQRSVRDSAGSLDGRAVTVTGFVVETGNGGSPRADGSRDGLDLARVRIVCCAADARTIRVHLDGNLGRIPDGTWLAVTGVVQTGSASAANRYTPTISVTDVRRVPAPENSYAY